ncbi:molybdopterin-guanine dinucleotide biosynthesis protein B [Bacillus gobiensis]|uniref:molybdopterin-guanine dinucleotide biosynthesis protein B n=1 Tax=Bacillus gobiensis TaxID=1441095 RepID=UPI003D1EB72F
MAVGQHPFILQIIGYKNSGKTTMMEKLAAAADKKGWSVGCLKHHGHGGEPDAAKNDSERFSKAGAAVSGVEGEGRLLLSIKKVKWTLEEIQDLYVYLNVDCLFIEGYKQAKYKKVVILKSEEDVELLQNAEQVIAVIYRDEKLRGVSFGVPAFHADDPLAVNYLINCMEEENFV